MLTTKGQKFWMFCIGLIALLFGAVILIPFKSIFTCEKIFLIEMIVKLGIIPVLLLLLSIYPNKLKYRQVSGCRNQSRIVSVMSYFPLVIYLTTIITESIYLLARGYVISGQPPLGVLSWSLWFVALTVFLVAIIAFYCVLPNVEMQLDIKEHVIFDFIAFVMMICFGALYYLISKSTHEIFLEVGPTGDPFLFIVYVCGLIGFGIHLRSLKNTFYADEVNVCLRYNDLDAKSFVSRMAEYNRAYNDIMNRFEDYFEEDYDTEIEEELEAVEEAPVEEVAPAVEEAPAEEVAPVVEEAPVEEVAPAVEETPVEEVAPAVEETPIEEVAPVVEETPVEEVAPVVEEKQQVEIQVIVDPEAVEQLEAKQEEVEKLEAEIEEIRLAKAAEEEAKLAEEAAKQAARLEAQKLAEEKALKNKEEMEPSFKKLSSFAKGLEDVSCIENSEKKQIRFLYGKKVFLIMTDTAKDYRLQFMVDPNKVVQWWNINSDIRPRSNKTDNWFKLTNKGSFTEELLFEIISSSRDFIVAETERIAAEKKAERALARQKAKEAKENK